MINYPPRTIGERRVAERLTWGHPTWWSFVDNSTFVDCDITINCSTRGIGIRNCTFTRCSIRTKRPLTGFQFRDSAFDECMFAGRFPGCEFGFHDGGGEPALVRGYLRNCDLSRAQLASVAIYRSDIDSLKLPPWPHVAILGPQAFAEVRALRSDLRWRTWGTVWRHDQSALVLRYVHGGVNGFSLPEAEARAAFDGCKSIRISLSAA